MRLRLAVNRTQGLLLAFLALAWLSLIVILVLAPETYDDVLRLPPGARLLSLVLLSALIGAVMLGVVKRWRWIFWLLLIANLAGVLRVAASLFELFGVLPFTGPRPGTSSFKRWLALRKSHLGWQCWPTFGARACGDLYRPGVWLRCMANLCDGLFRKRSRWRP